MSYHQVDRGILSSSLWAQGTPEQIKVWFYLLLAADPRTGIVEDADPGIALRCGLTLEVATAALDWLASPDLHSRTKEHEGRRIQRLPQGGFLVLNYLKHRDKDYSTPRWRKWRDRQQQAQAANEQTPANGVGNEEQEQEQEHTDNGRRAAASKKGNGTATGREFQRLEADPVVADLADHWASHFKRPGRELGVLRAASTALAGGYTPDAMKLVVRVVAIARKTPERFPDRGSIRWAVEHAKTDPAYLLRPSTLDKLMPEAEAWDQG